MAREDLADVDAISADFRARGLLKGRLEPCFIPVMGANHKKRREYGWE